ncbi:MAG: hypothetical protein MJ208_02465, partial [Bacilli bacterium]|nr:hypothetical protein [Bacilli bacterium]
FNHVSCSINFIECHDNHTAYDKVDILRHDLSKKDKLQRVSFANNLILYSLGIPFFHAGQEIGLSKNGYGNTYNAGDSLNYFNYSLLKERSFMIDSFKEAIKQRKKMSFFHEVSMSVIDRNASIIDLEKNGIMMEVNTRLGKEKHYRKVNFFINPNSEAICYYRTSGDTLIIPPMTVKVQEK